MGACLEDDPDLQKGVVALLQEQDETLRTERSVGLEAVTIEAVLFFVHEGKKTAVYVNEVADAANAILQGRGEAFSLSDRAVGGALNRLGLRTCRLSGKGRGLPLHQSVKRQAHELAHEYEVRIAEEKLSGCKECTAVRGRELGLASG